MEATAGWSALHPPIYALHGAEMAHQLQESARADRLPALLQVCQQLQFALQPGGRAC